MFRLLFALLIFQHYLRSVESNYDYEIPELKEEALASWELSTFAWMIRNSIQSAVDVPWGFVEQTLYQGSGIDMEKLKEFLLGKMALLIPAGIGLLCALLLPPISLLYFCCRCCCGQCGSEITMLDIGKQKPLEYIINGVLVLSMTGILWAMALCIPISGSQLVKTPRFMVHAVNATSSDLPVFIEKFVDDFSYLAKAILNDTIDDIKAKLDGLPESLADVAVDGANTYLENINQQVNTISSGITNLKTLKTTTSTTVDAIIQHKNALQTGMNDINSRYTALKSHCQSNGKTFCNMFPDGGGADALSVTIDTTKLTDLKNTMNELVTEADSVNLTEYSSLGSTTFDEVPQVVEDASRDSIAAVKSTLDTVPATINPKIDEAIEGIDVNLDFSFILNPLDAYVGIVEGYTGDVKSACQLLGYLLTSVAVFSLIGLSLGCLCTRRRESVALPSRTKAGNNGARFLMMSVFIAVLPATLVLIIGSVLMIPGGSVTVVCKPLQDLTIFERLVDSGLVLGGKNIGEMLLNDSSANISVMNMFMTCRNNGTVFSGLSLDKVLKSRINITEMFNINDFIPDLGADVVDNINDTVRNINLIDTSLFTDLSSKLDLPDVDSATSTQITTELDSLNLPQKAQEMSDLADSIPDPYYAGEFRSISTDIQALQTNDVVPLKQLVTTLQSVLNGLYSTCSTVKASISAISTSLNGMMSYISTQSVTKIVQTLDDFLSDMGRVPEDLFNTLLGQLMTNAGHCKILADIYDTFIGSLCVYFLDSFNALWASMYTGGIVSVILMIANCSLTKYFRKAEDHGFLVFPRSFRNRFRGRHANRGRNANPQYGTDSIVLTHYRELDVIADNVDGIADNSNNALQRQWNFKRLKTKRERMHRFITSPFYAKLFQDGTSDNLFREMVHVKQNLVPETIQISENLDEIDVVISEPELNSASHENEFEAQVDLFDENQNHMFYANGDVVTIQVDNKPSELTDSLYLDMGEANEHRKPQDKFIQSPVNALENVNGHGDDILMDTTEGLENTKTHLEEPLPRKQVLNLEDCTNDISSSNENERNSSKISNLGEMESDYESEDIDDKMQELDGTAKQEIACESENNERIYDQLEIPVRQVVCALCKGKQHINNNNNSIYSNALGMCYVVCDSECGTVTYSDFESNVSCQRKPSLISNKEMGKLSKSLEDHLDVFEETFENLTSDNTFSPSNREAEVAKQFESRSKPVEKLNIEVLPYRSIPRMRSPRSPFLFWKNMEENGCSHTYRTSGLIDKTSLEDSEHNTPDEGMPFKSNTLPGSSDDISRRELLSSKIIEPCGNAGVSVRSARDTLKAAVNYDSNILKGEQNIIQGACGTVSPSALQTLALEASLKAYVCQSNNYETVLEHTRNMPDSEDFTNNDIRASDKASKFTKHNLRKVGGLRERTINKLSVEDPEQRIFNDDRCRLECQKEDHMLSEAESRTSSVSWQQSSVSWQPSKYLTASAKMDSTKVTYM